MTITETQIITQFENSNVTRMVLQPSTLNMSSYFRTILDRRSQNNIDELPYVNNLNNNILPIDSETIININNSTSSERRIEFMRSILNHENINDNSQFLIANSTNQVRTYLHDLLIRSASYTNINEEDLYRIGNILLYTIANIDATEISIRDIIQELRTHLVIYNTDQIVHLLENNVTIYNDYLENIGLSTDEQLANRTNEFYEQINERIRLNRRRVLYAGLGLVGSMALGSVGFPPVGGIIVRSLSNISSTTHNSSEDIVRLRDIWDISLKKILDIVKNI